MKVDQPRTAAFQDALDEAHKNPDAPQPLCLNRPKHFADYRTPPSEEDCRDLCAPCPLLRLCRDSARIERPSWGIQGGIAWAKGRQYHWVRKLGHLDKKSARGVDSTS